MLYGGKTLLIIKRRKKIIWLYVFLGCDINVVEWMIKNGFYADGRKEIGVYKDRCWELLKNKG